jgi:serine/threonine-protein kinase
MPPAPPHFSTPHLQRPPAPKKSSRHGILIGALVFIATLIVVGGVITFVEVSKDDKSTSTKPTASAPGPANFTGTYRADYGPGTDLDGKTVAGAPATTSNWDVRSVCGAAGCVATAASASGQSLLSSMTFDQLGGAWLAVGLASADCGGEQASEVWVIVTLQPQADGTLTGETVRASTDSLCAARRAVKFTRSGDPDMNKVPDPAVLPPRVVTPADGLRGSYRQTTNFADGNILPAKVLTADTYCLRTGDRCLSLFHAGPEAVTMIFAKDKWTRNEVGTTKCAAGGTAKATITAEYPLPREFDDPIAQLNGRGTQTIAPGGACTGGGDFEDTFERTGD